MDALLYLAWGLVIALVVGTFSVLALTSPRRKGRKRPELEALGLRIVPANTLHWDGPAGGFWSVAANWKENIAPVAGNGDSLIFDNIPGTCANTSSVDDIQGLTIGSLTLNSAYSATLSLNQSLEVDGNVTIQPGTMTINAPNGNVLTVLNPA